jgi:hypothetical protein
MSDSDKTPQHAEPEGPGDAPTPMEAAPRDVEPHEVVQPGEAGDALDEKTQHEVVAAQLRGEAKAGGRGTDAVIAAVAEELEGIGLTPDEDELHRRYEEVDPDLTAIDDPGGSIDNPR